MSLVKILPQKLEDNLGDDLRYFEVVQGYECESCGDVFSEVRKRSSDFRHTICPSCQKETLIPLVGDVSFMMNNVTTLGKQAEINSKKMGSYKRSELEEQQKPAKQKKEAADKMRRLSNMTPEQKKRYILNGD